MRYVVKGADLMEHMQSGIHDLFSALNELKYLDLKPFLRRDTHKDATNVYISKSVKLVSSMSCTNSAILDFQHM